MADGIRFADGNCRKPVYNLAQSRSAIETHDPTLDADYHVPTKKAKSMHVLPLESDLGHTKQKDIFSKPSIAKPTIIVKSKAGWQQQKVNTAKATDAATGSKRKRISDEADQSAKKPKLATPFPVSKNVLNQKASKMSRIEPKLHRDLSPKFSRKRQRKEREELPNAKKP